jgi:N-glycosylase/DNA lyase
MMVAISQSSTRMRSVMHKIKLIHLPVDVRMEHQQPVSKKLIEEPEDFWMEPEKELRF